MKLSQILLTVVLVVGAIAVYDLVIRSGDSAAPADLTVVRETAVERVEPEILAPVTLEGTGDDLLVEDLERRLAALEASMTSGVRLDAVPDESPRPDGGAPEGVDESETEEREQDPDALNPRPAPVEELRDFRRKLQWVERQRRLEKQAKGIADWLDAQGVSLTNEQKWTVVREALRYRAKAKRITEQLGDDEAAREQRQATVQALTSEFKDRLFEIVPPAEADRIVDGMDQATAKAEAARRAKGGR